MSERENAIFLVDIEMVRVLQKLLEATKEDLRKRIKAVEKNRNERRKKYRFFSRFSKYSKALESAQKDLEKLLDLVNYLNIVEENENYYIIYRGEKIKSAKDYKCCTRAYETLINSIGFKENIVFSRCTLVEDLIEDLPLILIKEE